MTDDLEPRLEHHLARQASAVDPVPDTADLAARIGAKGRRTTRGLGAALALALVAGPVGGWALARSTEADRQSLSVAGGTSASNETSPPTTSGGGDGLYELGGGYLDYIGPALALVDERTTDEGLHLTIRLGKPYDAYTEQPGDPCLPDGVVRVGVLDDDLIGVATMETWPDHGAFGVTGAAEGRPIWVVVARAEGGVVEATFPNGTVDRTEAVGGVAVLAAYAQGDQAAEALLDDVVQVTGMAGEPRTVTASVQGHSCTPVDLPEPSVTMPDPGEPPTDEEAARAEITELFSQHGGGDARTQVDLHEEPAVWLDAALRFEEQQPEYFEWAKEVYGVVDEIVFTAPDRATVRFTLVSDNPSIPAPGEMVGEAVLIDGTWKSSIEGSCAGLALAGIECDYSLKE